MSFRIYCLTPQPTWSKNLSFTPTILVITISTCESHFFAVLHQSLLLERSLWRVCSLDILIFISVFRNVWFQYHIPVYLHTLLPLNPISDIIGVISRFLLSLKKVSLYQTLQTRSLFCVLFVWSFVFVSHFFFFFLDGTDAQSEDCILTTYNKVSLQTVCSLHLLYVTH